MIHPYYKTPYVLQLIRAGELRMVIPYLLTGMITSVSDYSLFFVFLNILDSGLLAATVVAYIGGLLVNFSLSRFWVYSKNAFGQQLKTSVWRYLSLLAFNLLLTYIMLWAMERWLGISPLIGKFVVWTFLTFWNYAANKYWVFKGPRQVKKNVFYNHLTPRR